MPKNTFFQTLKNYLYIYQIEKYGQIGNWLELQIIIPVASQQQIRISP